MAHIHWLITSPRLPAGLLSGAAWKVLHSGTAVYAATQTPLVQALRDADVEVAVVPVAEAIERLTTDGGVWLAGPDGDQALVRKLSGDLADGRGGLEIELLYGSWDPPGARLLDVVEVIDRLRSPGGCPWDAAQTHESLVPFLLEEAYETVDAIHSGNPGDLREELGDLLIQPLLHARFAAEDEQNGFDVDDVAGDVVAKMIRRHPHVFGEKSVESMDELGEVWEDAKRAEKPERKYVTDGVPTAQPALSLAAKYLSRVERAGLDAPVGTVTGTDELTSRHVGQELLRLVARAHGAGIDPELALRRAALDYAENVRRIQDAQATD